MTVKELKKIIKNKIKNNEMGNEYYTENFVVSRYTITNEMDFDDFMQSELKYSSISLINSFFEEFDIFEDEIIAWIFEQKCKFWNKQLKNQDGKVVIDRKRYTVAVIQEC